METVKEPLAFKEQIVFEQMRLNYRNVHGTFDALDSKAQVVIAVSSIIITILAGFQVAKNPHLPPFVIFAVLVMYALTLGFSFAALFPRDIDLEPIEPEWKAIYVALKEPDDKFLYGVLSRYGDAITHNLSVNELKTGYVRLSFFLLGLTVGIALLLALA